LTRPFFAFLALAACVACPSQDSQLEEHRAKGAAYAREGRLNDALRELRAALKLDPSDARTCRSLARIYEARGDLRRAHFYFYEASRLNPDDLGSKLEIARLILGDYPDEAMRLALEVIGRDPENSSAWIRISEAELVNARAKEALVAARKATEAAPDDPNAFHQLGRVHQARFRRARLLSLNRDEELEQHLEILTEALEAFDRAAELYAETRGGAANQLERARVLAMLPGTGEQVEAAYHAALELTIEKQRAQLVLNEALDFGRRRSPELERWALEQQTRLFPGVLKSWGELAELAEGNQPVAGLGILDQMIEKLPTSGRARIAYARFLAEHDRHDDALAFLAAAEADSEVDFRQGIALERGLLLLEQRRVADAIAVADELRARAPDSPSAALLDANVALVQRRIQKAIAILNGSLEKAADGVDARKLLARAYYAFGDDLRAASEISRVLAARPVDLEMLSLQSQVQLDQGLAQESIRSLMQVRRTRPLTQPERLVLAQAYYENGQRRRAIPILIPMLQEPVYSQAVAVYAEREMARRPERIRALLEGVWEDIEGPERQKIVELLTALDLHEERTEEALVRINEIITERGATIDLVRLRSKALIAAGLTAAAERDLLLIIENDSSDSEAAELLVKLYASRDRNREAITVLESATQVDELPAETRVILARLYWAEGDAVRARDLLTTVVEERTDLPHARNDLAFVLSELREDPERALQLAQEARAALPDDPDVADTLGWVYLRRGLTNPAAAQFVEAIELSESPPRSAIYHHHLGLALRELGRTDEAVRAFESALAADPEFSKQDEAQAALSELRGQERAAQSG
jgi:tetratricopeptide (TPR) repeat protein